MRIEIDGTESPAVLRAIMQLLGYLAEPPSTAAVPSLVSRNVKLANEFLEDIAGGPEASAIADKLKQSDVQKDTLECRAIFAPAAQSAIPLPPPIPAPSIVAAPASAIVPEVPTAGIPMPPGAGLPPVPPVPPAPAPSVAPPPAGVATDKSGLPHDPRIHSAAPTITADGMWRKRRGLNDPALVARVEAELRQTMGAPVPTQIPLAPTAPASVDFVSLIRRITHETEVTKMLTMEEAEGAAKAAGLPGLAFLAARPDLVADVSHRIDVILAS